MTRTRDERPGLKHSDASTFSGYLNKTSHPLQSSSATVCHQRKDFYEANSEKRLTNHVLDYNSDTHGSAVNCQKNIIFSSTADQPKQGENQIIPCPQQRLFPAPIPVRGIRFESLLPPMGCKDSGLSAKQTPPPVSYFPQSPSFPVNPFFPSNPETTNCPERIDQNADSATDQMDHEMQHKLESFENRGHFWSAAEQSGSSSFCNGVLSHFNNNSIGSGSNGNASLVRAARAVSQSGNEANTAGHDGNLQRSIQREAALTKFRMKRKDRCYEKVRYESRKKLVEQRPRVKGQFIRHVHNEAPSVETDNSVAATAHS